MSLDQQVQITHSTVIIIVRTFKEMPEGQSLHSLRYHALASQAVCRAGSVGALVFLVCHRSCPSVLGVRAGSGWGVGQNRAPVLSAALAWRGAPTTESGVSAPLVEESQP